MQFKLINGDKIYVCGYKMKEALKYAPMWMEFDVPEMVTEEEKRNYVPGATGSTKSLIYWIKRRHIGYDTECTEVFHVPPGQHVLTISTSDRSGRSGNGAGKSHNAALTHLITF